MQHRLVLDLDRERLRQRAIAKFDDNMAAVAAAWPRALEKAPHRSTIGRQIKHGGLPKNEDAALGLAGALDIDPMMLVSIPRSRVAATIENVENALARKPGRLAPFQFLRNFVMPDHDWPPERIARNYFDRPWRTFEFAHRATSLRNYYAAITIQPNEKDDLQLWHFAWRPREGNLAWRPYGVVERCGEDVDLFSFTGITDRSKIRDRVVVVETWFGEGAAEFRIASLHAFACEVSAATPDGTGAVRFGTHD